MAGGTGGMGGTGGAGPTTCAMAPMIFMTKCQACHSIAGAPMFGGFDMETAGWEKKLIGMGPKSDGPPSAMCKDMMQIYLKPGVQPAAGLFIDKISGSTPPCGVKMPQVGTLTAAEVKCIKDWASGVVAAGP